MLANDSQQIYFDLSINGVPKRRTFSGIIYLQTQGDRSAIQSPNDSLYFVISSRKFYYYYVNTWKTLSTSPIVYTTTVQMEGMTQCDQQKFYLDTTTNSLFYGRNVSNSVLWINLSGYDKISDYVGNVNIRKFDGQNYNNIISTQTNTSNTVIGSSDNDLKLNGTIKYNGNDLNTANSLVKLDNHGKIASSLMDVYTDAYFVTKIFSVKNLTNNKKTFTFQQLGIQQPTIVQLLDDQNLIRDDIIPVYWKQNGLQINFQPIASLIDEQTGDFKIKYLVAQQYNAFQTSKVSTLATKTFDPYGLTNNIKAFSFSQLGINQPTMLQLIDDQGIVRDDVIPVYWMDWGIEINFNPISQHLTQSGHIWQLKYLVSSFTNANNNIQKDVIEKQFTPYGLTNNIKTFSFIQLNLTHKTIVQLVDNENLVRNDVVPMYWTNNGLQIDFTPLINQIEQGMIWKIEYISHNSYKKQMITISSTDITPTDNLIYYYTLNGNETFTFSNVSQIMTFRLYLKMNSLVTFTLPSNIIWYNQPNFLSQNALYMLVFEWNPILNKWMGNQMFDTVSLS